MIHTLAYSLLFGKPLIMYGGLLTFFLLLVTAAVGFLNYRGIRIMPFKWHPWLAAATITAAVIHALFGLSVYFNF
ncbi:MAG: hypothetical protein Q7R92_02810 [bacterium]|nr:hypothetical protein [bacterium]